MNTKIADHIAWVRAYVEKKRKQEEGDVSPIDLKFQHTLRVLSHAQNIVRKECFDEKTERCALLAALYHDIGRFEQYLRYHTFKDKESVNHGELGVEILSQEGCLQNEDALTREIVIQAVGLHNKYALPETLSENVLLVTHVVRDADKLDIVRVIDSHLRSEKPYNPTVVLSLPDDPDLSSKEVIHAALTNSVASYGALKSVNDFRLLLATWINDMNFAASRYAFIHQGHALAIVEGLPEDGVYAQARRYMIARLKV